MPQLFSGNPGENLLAPEDWAFLAAALHLPGRELSVAVLLFEGKTRLEIADQLGKSLSTVRSYIDRLFAKLQVEDKSGFLLRLLDVDRELKRQRQ